MPQPMAESARQPISIQGRLLYRGSVNNVYMTTKGKLRNGSVEDCSWNNFERGVQSTLSLHANLTYTDDPQLPLRCWVASMKSYFEIFQPRGPFPADDSAGPIRKRSERNRITGPG